VKGRILGRGVLGFTPGSMANVFEDKERLCGGVRAGDFCGGGDSVGVHAKTAERIEILFGLETSRIP